MEASEIFSRLLGGRKNVYTIHYKTPSGAERYRRSCIKCPSGYADCGKCRGGGFISLSAEAVDAHLHGQAAVGIYPSDEKGRSRFSVIELSGEDFRPMLRVLAAVCRGAGLTHLCELTDFGEAGRIWLFYRDPISVRLAAETAADLLREGRIALSGMTGDLKARILPVITHNSDFGKPVMLPLFDIESGFSVFTDDELNPIADGLELLPGIIPDELRPVELPADKNDFPDTVHVELCDKLYVSTRGFSTRGIAALGGLARFPNPELSSEADEERPAFVQCVSFSNGMLHLPRGVMSDLHALLEPYSKIEISDGRRVGEPIYLRAKEKPPIAFAQAAENLLMHDCATVAAPVGSGKTELMFSVMEKLRRSTLILTTEKAAAVRWRNRLIRHFSLSDGEISCVINDRSYPNGRLDVALLGSKTELWLAEQLPHYGLVIAADVDRLHCGGDVLRSVMECVCAEKVYAVTTRPVSSTRFGDYVRLYCGDIFTFEKT